MPHMERASVAATCGVRPAHSRSPAALPRERWPAAHGHAGGLSVLDLELEGAAEAAEEAQARRRDRDEEQLTRLSGDLSEELSVSDQKVERGAGLAARTS